MVGVERAGSGSLTAPSSVSFQESVFLEIKHSLLWQHALNDLDCGIMEVPG
uniref:Uncharacterized protein n=1 Tax=Anguilla anguilla TaxID=7936 RepID=A0A0E9RPE1_ANGAN